VRFSEGVKLNRHGVRIVALLGTTGVGKTTTLAKIAAKFVLEQRTNVALITADTYRISAVEQLKTYSDILELPLEIVYNPAELTAAIERHRHKELILIDTAGRSQHNEYQMRELDEFMRVNPRIEKHLVISATTKFTDAKQIMNKFAQVNPDKIIFTKIDETGSLGMIVNLLNDNRYSLSYLTTGQSVPDDIERANAEVLTNLLLQKVEE
ncbi:MAG: flagellar biosynthesis protein FlhF, partial [Selenomonadaceae bacterium]|nr:flagellar biosynthesis protein FlhF [Selenomonadaceae bacterium]